MDNKTLLICTCYSLWLCVCFWVVRSGLLVLPDWRNLPVSSTVDQLLPSPSGHSIFDNPASSFVGHSGAHKYKFSKYIAVIVCIARLWMTGSFKNMYKFSKIKH